MLGSQQSEEDIKRYFNQSAVSYYQDYAREDSAGDSLNKKYLTYLIPLSENKRVLEIGCGPGTLSKQIAKTSGFNVGLDFSEDMLGLAGKPKDRPYFLIADAKSLPFKNDSFDLVFLIRTLQHIPDVNKTLSEITRIIPADSLVVFDFINIWNPFAFIRAALGRVFKLVYLRADNKKSVANYCQRANIKIDHIYPLVFFVDMPNLKKYLPWLRAFRSDKLSNLFKVETKESSFLSICYYLHSWPFCTL